MAASSPGTSSSSNAGPALLPLAHHQGKPAIKLGRPVIVIGSRSTARIHLLSRSVSKAHALLVHSNGRTYIRDLASRAKVIINDQEISEAVLNDGDHIKIGAFEFRYIAGPGEANAGAGDEAIPAKLEVSGSEYPVVIEQRVVLIGRRPNSDITLLENSVSTSHAVLFEMDGHRYIRDLGSRTGTYVNNVSTHQHQLTPGDVIHIGDTNLTYLANEVVAAVVIEEIGEDPFKIPAPPEPPELLEANEKTIAPSTSAEVPASVEIETDLDVLSVEPEEAAESLSTPVAEADKQLEPAELNPRTGWRATAAEPDMPPPPIEVEAVEEEVIKFPDSISADESAGEAGAAAAVLDLTPVDAPQQAEVDLSALDEADELPPIEAIDEPLPQVEDTPQPILNLVKPPPPRQTPIEVPPMVLPPVKRSYSLRPRKGRELEDEAAALSAEVDKPLEIIEPTEPTPESALPPDTEELPLDTPAVDELTDTGFGKAVRDFAGPELGELVEPPSLETPPLETPQPEAPPPLPLPKAEPAVPAMPAWGANQDNFLGGMPVDLTKPPPKLPFEDKPDEAAVKDLIDELDDVAAAAEAAAAPSPPQSDDELPPIIPAIPPRPRKLGVFRGSRKRDDENAPPYNGGGSGGKGGSGKVATGFDGLSMPGVREMDVFSQTAPPALDLDAPDTAPMTPMDQIQAEPAIAEIDETPRRARTSTQFNRPQGAFISDERLEPGENGGHRQRVLPALPGTVEGTLVGKGRPAVTYAADLTEAEAAFVRRKYFRRACILAAIMLILMGAATLGIPRVLGNRATVEGAVAYNNIGELNQDERLRFQNDQKRLLKEDVTRHLARRKLNEHPELDPGFLDDQIDYFKTADRAYFMVETPYSMIIRVEGKDPDADRARVAAMMAALYDNNNLLIDEAARQRRALEDLNKQINQHQRQVDGFTQDIERLRTLGESRPSPEKITQIETEVAGLEKIWNDSMAAVRAAQVELERVKSVPAGENGGAQPAKEVDDTKLAAMKSQLNDLTAKVDAAKSASAQKALDARKSLDASLDTFSKQITDAQGMMNGSPELSAYVQAAQKLQETTRQLTQALIRRQEQQFARLTELKQRLNEKMEQRRIEIWQGDKQLQELTERLAILERQYNAAVGGGLQKETDELKVQVDLTRNMVKARQDLLPGDTFWAEAIQQLQVIIDSTKKNIDEDRAKTEQLLTSLQKSFTTASSESIEKLPEEQKQVAATLQKQLDQINATRQQYNKAVDAGAEDGDLQLKSQMATLQAGIDARRKQLADENLKSLRSKQEQERLAAVEVKQVELNKLNEAETAAREKYFAKHKELRDAQQQLTEAKDNAEKLDGLIRKKDVAQRSLSAALAQLENKQNDVKHAVEPIKPSDNDVTAKAGRDKRLAYTLATDGAILVFFMGLILWTLHTASLEAPAGLIHAAQLRPVDEKKRAGANGKGTDGTEEDHTPAII